MDLVAQKKMNVTTQNYYTISWTDKVHAGASAATVPLLDGFYLHDEDEANNNTKYTLLHRDSYEKHGHAGDAGDQRILREKVFETKPWVMQFSKFLCPDHGNDGVAQSSIKKTKIQKREKRALRPSQQQHAATARTLDEGEFNDEHGAHTSEEERENLDDGRYEKTIYVKTAGQSLL